MTRWFEDIVLDEVHPLGSHTFTADEIIRFAKAYDPQYFHVDAEPQRTATSAVWWRPAGTPFRSGIV